MDRDPMDEAWRRLELERFAQSRLSRRQALAGAAGLAALGLAGRGSGRAAAAPAKPTFTPAAVRAAQRALRQTGGDSAQAAVDAAKALDPRPEKLTLIWEEALQSEDPTKFSGPKWEELTGIKIETVSKPFTDLFSSQVTEHLAGTGAYDVLSLNPAWGPDFIAQGLPVELGP